MSYLLHWKEAGRNYPKIEYCQFDQLIPASASDAIHIPYISYLHQAFLNVVNALNFYDLQTKLAAFKIYRQAGGQLRLYDLEKYILNEERKLDKKEKEKE